jgi:hypothetical protein
LKSSSELPTYYYFEISPLQILLAIVKYPHGDFIDFPQVIQVLSCVALKRRLMQCCGSGIFIPDPDFYPFRIPDLGSRILDPGSKNSNKKDR